MPTKPKVVETDMRQREIRIGVMLPLHNINGDGKRMVEYYRGVLMACDSLRANGISTDIRAWNVAEDSDISDILKDPHAANCDLIIGPLYTKQVKTLGDFAREHNIIVKIDELRAQIVSFREKTLGRAHFFVPLRFSDTLHNSLERYREFREKLSVGNIRENIKGNIRENIDKIKRK